MQATAALDAARMTAPSSAAIESHVLGADGGPDEALTSEDAVKRGSGATGGTVGGSDESVTTAAEAQDGRKDDEKGEDVEKDAGTEVKVRHRWCAPAVLASTLTDPEDSP